MDDGFMAAMLQFSEREPRMLQKMSLFVHWLKVLLGKSQPHAM
jgi:hypothetical protein